MTVSNPSNFKDFKTFPLGSTGNLQSTQKSTRNGEQLHGSLTTAESTGPIVPGWAQSRLQTPPGSDGYMKSKYMKDNNVKTNSKKDKKLNAEMDKIMKDMLRYSNYKSYKDIKKI